MKRLKVWVTVLIMLSILLSGVRLVAANTSGVDRLQGAYLQIAVEDNRKWSPAVAYASNHNEYLIVWETIEDGGHHAIYGRRVSASGQMYDEFLVYSGKYNSLQPAVAYDITKNSYLVVWAYDSAGDGTDGDIYGRFIPWDGPIDGEPAFGIDTSRDNSDKPKLAYSLTSQEFLIVWKVETTPSYIAGGIIYNNKTGYPVAISSGPEVRDFPDVTYNLMRNEFVVVWDEDVGRDVQDLDIYAIRLDYTGTPMGSEFAVTSSTSNEQHPTVAACYSADEYLFAWQQQVNQTADDNIFGRMMTGSGNLEQIYGLEGTTLPQRNPELSCNPAGNKFFLVWHDQYAVPYPHWGVWGAVIHTDLFVEPGFQIVAPSDQSDRLYPAVAYGNQTALVVWQHGRDNSPYLDIWGQLVWPYGITIPLLYK